MRVIFRNKFVRWVLTPLVVLFGLGWGYFQYNYPTVTLRYRLTLEAMTPAGPKTGSGVIEVSYGSQFNLNGGGRNGVMHVVGEAINLDMGKGRYLFSTLTNNASGRPIGTDVRPTGALNDTYLPVVIFGFKWKWGEESELKKQISLARTFGPRNVPLESLPTLVTFKDINDPATVQLVQPSKLEDVFGEGFSLNMASLELVDDRPKLTELSNFGFFKKFETQTTLSGSNLADPAFPGEIYYLGKNAFFKDGLR
jgi:hypothetical protein